MEVMSLANGQMPIPCFDRRGNINSSSSSSTRYCSYSSKPNYYSWCGVLNSWGRPMFSCYLGKRKSGKRMESLGLRLRALSSQDSVNGVVVGGGFVEDFEFKPSFNEYLKALESIKSGVDRKEEHESRGFGPRGGDGRKLRRSKRVMERGSVLEFTENDEIKESDVVSSEVVDRKGREIRQFNDERNDKESSEDTGLKRKSRGATTDALWFRDQSSSINLEFDEFSLGKREKIQHDGEFGLLDEERSFNRSMEGKFSNSKEMLERKKVIEREGLDVRANRMSSGHVMDGAKVDQYAEKRIVRRNGSSFIRRNHSFHEISDDDGSYVERAAFRNFEQLDDSSQKPIVSRREVEERIQKLAKWYQIFFMFFLISFSF